MSPTSSVNTTYFRSRVRWMFNAYLSIMTPDPVRRVLNRAVAVLLMVVTILTLFNLALFPDMGWIVWPAVAITPVIWWLNHRGTTAGAIFLCAYFLVFSSLGTDPQSYGHIGVPLEYAFSIFVAGLFIRPSAAWVMLPLQILCVAGAGYYVGIDPHTIGLYVKVLLPSLALAAVVASMAAAMFSDALRNTNAVNQQLAALNADLEAKVAERTQDLRTLMETREQEIGDVIHDLGHGAALLFSVVNHALVQMLDLGERAQAIVTNAFEGIGLARVHYERIVADLRDAVRLQHQGLTLQPSTFKLEELVQELLVTLRMQEATMESPTQLTLTIDEHVPDVWADVDRIRRVLYNVVGNALNYSRHVDDGAHVALHVCATPTMGVVRITDNGQGISADDLLRIGQRFQRVATDKTGMGIGLYLCTRIVQQSGGTLIIDSPGRDLGTTVTILLPLKA